MDPAAQGASGTFVWQAPGKKIAVHLALDVVDRLAAEVMRGFGAVPKRGAEVGGVLVGVVTGVGTPGGASEIRIEDFEPVPCKYVRGPSYLLTEYERMLFEEVCERRSPGNGGRTCAVGFYRSHTRDGLALDREDLELLDRYFPSPHQIALLVKPYATKPSVGGFFVRENGSFPATTPLEFPFRRWEMTGEEPPRRPAMEESRPDKKGKERQWQAESGSFTLAPSTDRIFSAEPLEVSEAPAFPGPPKSRTGIWMVAAFIFLLLGVLLGYQASRVTAPRRPSDFALALAIERTGQNLTVHWNPASPAIHAATAGLLEIDDSGEAKRVELDRANLSSGNFVYRNVSEKVRFRLVVNLDPGLTVTEELEWPR